MRFQFCPLCGRALSSRTLGDEGAVPWCDGCDRPFFDVFSTCIIALAANELGEVALLRQDFLSRKYATLVSGYIKPGESAEETARREIQEELGLETQALIPFRTFFMPHKDMLMVGFLARVKKADFQLSCEVEGAEWVDARQALELVHPNGSVSQQMIALYLDMAERGTWEC